MDRLWIAGIGAAAATFAVSYALHRQQLPERPAEPPGVDSMTPEVQAVTRAAKVERQLATATEAPLPTGDTTGRLREAITVGELLDGIDADTGEDFTPVDRERLASLLRSDPELRRAVRE